MVSNFGFFSPSLLAMQSGQAFILQYTWSKKVCGTDLVVNNPFVMEEVAMFLRNFTTTEL